MLCSMSLIWYVYLSILNTREAGYIKQRMSTRTINYLKIDESSPVFYGEDPELVDITLRNIRNTDKNNDGGLDIEEVAS